MSSSNSGASSPLANARVGTQVLYQWAKWQSQHGVRRPARVIVFRKGDVRLAVHDYGNQCGILTIGAVKPKLKRFRIWSQPLFKVVPRLAKYGWKVVSDDSREVSHAH